MTFRFLSATKSQLAEHIPSWHPSVTGELNPKSEIPLDHASGWQYTPCTSGFETFHHGWFYEFFFEPKTRCWQLTYFWSFHPESLGKMNQPNLTVAYFSHGVNRNHQPVGASYWAMSSVWIAAVSANKDPISRLKSCGDSSLKSRSQRLLKSWLPEKQATKMYILIVELCRNKMYVYIDDVCINNYKHICGVVKWWVDSTYADYAVYISSIPQIYAIWHGLV